MENRQINFGKYDGISWDKLSSEYLCGLADMGNLEAKKEILRRENLPIEEQIVGFGKYIGKYWIDLDMEYLCWITSTMEPTSDKVMLAYEAIDYKQNNKVVEADYSQNQEFDYDMIDIIEVD
jgi:uncharacterized protein (DUF3820 family)